MYGLFLNLHPTLRFAQGIDLQNMDLLTTGGPPSLESKIPLDRDLSMAWLVYVVGWEYEFQTIGHETDRAAIQQTLTESGKRFL
jgi:hypothetical protein